MGDGNNDRIREGGGGGGRRCGVRGKYGAKAADIM